MSTLLRHYRHNWPFDWRSVLPRVTTAAGVLGRLPFYQFERLRWRRAIDRHEMPEAPLFIIGHWRSGTTHLHNLLSCDPRFAWITFAQSTMPWDMILSEKLTFARRVVQSVLPETRGMDNVKLSLDHPQEEEWALANMGSVSYAKCYYFPRKFHEHFRQAILFEGVSERDMVRLKRAYLRLVQTLSYINEGRPLLMKNPSSTARMLFLKSLFPDARFIHIVRNPYSVFSSSRARFSRMLSAFAWQKYDDLDLDSITIENYRVLMQRYLDQRSEIPESDLFEVRYEDVVSAPCEEVGKIYDHFAMPGKEAALEKVGAYTMRHRDYQKNRHTVTRAQFDRIREEWGFALDRFGYAPPEGLPVVG